MNINKEILKTIKYFDFFAYQPTLEEIHTFLPAKISKNELKTKLNRLKYTPPQYGIGRKISRRKLHNWRFRIYIKLLSIFPQIKLIGLSGSIAMMSSSLDDDIDLFIITQKKRLFTGRFLAVIFAYLMGLKRKIEQKKAPSKVCLNLFFDESNLRVPKFKYSEYVAHEILQMKPIIIKNNIYEKFLKANQWVQEIFPNSSWMISKIKYQRSKTSSKFKFLSFELPTRLFEKVIKRLQLTFINRHRTTEIITNTQLWFHPEDFEKKMKF